MKLDAPARPGAANHRGSSKQDYETPPEFMAAVERRFGKLNFDLAASAHNRKVDAYFDLACDSLNQPWEKLRGLLWLNPEFADIAPWAKKCAELYSLNGGRGVESHLLFLVPLSADSNWWLDHVHDKAEEVLFCNPRLKFVGCVDPYPKPIALVCYGPGGLPTRYAPWRWKP